MLLMRAHDVCHGIVVVVVKVQRFSWNIRGLSSILQVAKIVPLSKALHLVKARQRDYPFSEFTVSRSSL